MKQILVPVDFSAGNSHLAEFAARIARPFRGRIWLLHCIEPNLETDSSGCQQTEEELGQDYIDEYRQLVATASPLRCRGIDVQLIFAFGSVAKTILTAADQHRVDLIVMGSQGHDAVWEHEVGGVTEDVLSQSSRPVLVIPSSIKSPRNRLLNSYMWN